MSAQTADEACNYATKPAKRKLGRPASRRVPKEAKRLRSESRAPLVSQVPLEVHVDGLDSWFPVTEEKKLGKNFAGFSATRCCLRCTPRAFVSIITQWYLDLNSC